MRHSTKQNHDEALAKSASNVKPKTGTKASCDAVVNIARFPKLKRPAPQEDPDALWDNLPV